MKVLFISVGLVTSLSGVNSTKGRYLSRHFFSDMTHTVNDRQLHQVDVQGGTLLGCYVPKFLRRVKLLAYPWIISNMLFRAVKRHRSIGGYDAIVAREPIVAGVIAVFVSRLLRLPLLVEMNGNYSSKVVWGEENYNLVSAVKRALVMRLIPFVLNRAGAIRVLYPWQLQPYSGLKDLSRKTFCFHEFTQVENIMPSNNCKPYLLALGSPWFIKGFDLLIKAFVMIAEHHKDITLKVVGYFPRGGHKYLESLANGNKNIQICKPVKHSDAQLLISECKCFILPSRTEAMGRVLLESMAHRKAIIASDADGIPHYVKNEINGLIFESGDAGALAKCISRILEDDKLRLNIASNGERMVRSEYTEKQYADRYAAMLKSVL
ncbi:glycosyltransferase family 4 protein [Glaciecola sp. XM2]|uniref:glycosyltransferase family 4 protein n=1 Tax=Glaciecola sp. XM2 TaxID=1914931 RepID=UPI001BDEE4C6|nr:glycosyltransferase family 4 protein [Glaciecola sp. XM2]MBT1450650.1 glycosyltransferase family 4 protein [Glaciecola sp. XM2]